MERSDAAGLVRCRALPLHGRQGELTGFVGTLACIEELTQPQGRLDISQALQRGEFILHYQPIVSAADGMVMGAEALVRWVHPTQGIILPSTFIPAAEESGQVVALGEWVLREACKQARRWQDQGEGRLPFMTVNLSPVQLQVGDLAGMIRGVLEETNLDPESLELELTEAVRIEDNGPAWKTIADLVGVGVRLSLDDFGAGYSNLAYLCRRTFSTLKIDRFFIRDLPHDRGRAAIVLAAIQMAHSLDMRVVAEGVEDHGCLRFLSGYGCDLVQGYLFSRPVVFDEMPK